MIICGKSDIGKKRLTNQDSFNITELEDGVFLCTVCDGMGGANGGNIASNLAVTVFTESVKEEYKSGCSDILTLLCDAVTKANTAVYMKAADDPMLKGMGTTLVAAVFKDNVIYAVNVGDSRMYVINGDEIQQVTKDHSYVQYLVDLGKITVKEAENAPMRNIITRSVGNEPETEPDTFEVKADGTGYIVLCTDGLSNCVKNDVILRVVSGEGEPDKEELDKRAEQLIALANEGGGIDNITVIVGKY